MTHPPQETPLLHTAHLNHSLQEQNRSESCASRSLFGSFQKQLPAFSLPSSLLSPTLPVSSVIVGGVAASIPLLFLMLAQPATPHLKTALADSTQQYVATSAQYQPTPQNIAQQNTNDATTQQAELASASQSGNITEADATVNQLSERDKKYHYQLSLAQAYLKKAIRVSQDTKDQPQTPEQKQEILTHIDASMQAANTAIELIPDRGDAFFVRAQIYHISSFVSPELKELSDQDRVIANALGVSDEYLSDDSVIENPLNFLPTQQASNQPTAMIAEPEQGNTDVVATETTDNVTSGVVTIPAGSFQATVELAELTEDMTISLSNKTNATPVKISSRSDSSHPKATHGSFTIELDHIVETDVTVAWNIEQL